MKNAIKSGLDGIKNYIKESKSQSRRYGTNFLNKKANQVV